jgi:rRNA maturation endonuclease Nob1
LRGARASRPRRKACGVLDVHNVEIRVPRVNVEVRKESPKAWSVVRHPYLVCPGCHSRRYVSGEPKDHRCPDCGNTFAIDWKDSA